MPDLIGSKVLILKTLGLGVALLKPRLSWRRTAVTCTVLTRFGLMT